MKIAVCLSRFQLHILTWFCEFVESLAVRGFEVDLFIQNSGNEIPRFSSGVTVYNLTDPRIKSDPRVKPVGGIESFAGDFAELDPTVRKVFSLQDCLAMAMLVNFAKREQYDYCIGAESGGLVMAYTAAQVCNARLGYLSFELYDQNNPGVWKENISDYREFESSIIEKLDLFMIQCRRREQAYYDIIRTDKRPQNVLYFPVSLMQGSNSGSGRYWHDKFSLRPDTKIILYMGMLSGNRFLEEMVSSAQHFPEDCRLVLNGPPVGRVEKYINTLKQLDKSNKVLYSISDLPWNGINSLISSADIGVVFYDGCRLNDRLTGVSSAKMAAYMRAGIPVLCSDLPSFREIIGRYGNGIALSDALQISKGVFGILGDYENYCRGARRAFKEVYDLNLHADRLSEHIKTNAGKQQQINYYENGPENKMTIKKNSNEPRFSFVMIVLNGMPLIEYSLSSIYDIAHEIIIVEGAVEKCMFAANEDGSSVDGTVELLRRFPDPQGKIKLVQGRWPEKCEMQNEALKQVTGDYIWLIDSDEVYKSEHLSKVKEIIEADPEITEIDFIPDNFWKGFDHIFYSEKLTDRQCHYRRLFKYTSGAYFTTHRPPTLYYPDKGQTSDKIRCIDGLATRRAGIKIYHYSYVFDSQVSQKMNLYRRYGWDKGWGVDIEKWYSECFCKWTPQNRNEIDSKWPIWTGDKNSVTLPFEDSHPEAILPLVEKCNFGGSVKRARDKDSETLRAYSAQEETDRQSISIIGGADWQGRVLDAWQYIELDEPVKKRQGAMESNIANGRAWWNIHVALSFLSARLQPKSYLEVGVRTGCSMVSVLHNCDGADVTGVDIWSGEYSSFPNTIEYTVNQLKRYCESTGKKHNIELIHGNSHIELKKLIQQGRRYDLITIDGDHSKDGAMEDLEDALRLLGDKGAIVFDDIVNPGLLFLKEVAIDFGRRHRELNTITNDSQDNGTVIFLKNIEPAELLGNGRVSLCSSKNGRGGKNLKVAVDYVETGMAVGKEGHFSSCIRELFSELKPRKVIETGTYYATGTTSVIAEALQRQSESSVFYTIEVNPEYYQKALGNIRKNNYQVNALNGLSVPRSLLPSLEQIERETVTDVEYDDIFVDHREHVRAQTYMKETDFDNVPDNLLFHCLKSFEFRPDFILLDSAGHMGYVEFKYLIEMLQGPCYIALDDIKHIKHHKSFRHIESDSRFEVVSVSDEKFGFCIAKFTPARKPLADSAGHILWLRTDAIGDAILSSSMLPYIKNRYAGADITVVCQEHVAELYEACPDVANILTVPSGCKFSSVSDYENFIKRVKKLGPDLLLNSTYSVHGYSDLPGLEFIDRRVAFRHGINTGYTDIIVSEGDYKPELGRHLDFLNGLGVDVSGVSLEPCAWITQEDAYFAKVLFEKFDFQPERTIAFFAGVRTESRQYEDYGKALARFCERHCFKVIALGSERDFEVNEKQMAEAGVEGLNLSGKLTLRQSAAVLAGCRLALGGETGLGHMACAVGTPNVILLGGGHFARFMPYSKYTTAVSLPLECMCCNWECRQGDYHCVKGIGYEIIDYALEYTFSADLLRPRQVFVPQRYLREGSGLPGWRDLSGIADKLGIEVLSMGSEQTARVSIKGNQTQSANYQ